MQLAKVLRRTSSVQNAFRTREAVRLVRSNQTKAARSKIANEASTPGSTLKTSVSSSTSPSTIPKQEPISSTVTAEINATTSATAKETATNPTMPDIQSTSLGLEDPTNDPKWKQKHILNYIGMFVAFGICYKSIGWYADKLDEEGKLKRDDVEERKAARSVYDEELKIMKDRHELLMRSQQQPPQMQAQAQAQAQAQVLPAAVPPTADYTPIQQHKNFVSEIDQLRMLRDERAVELKSVDSTRRDELRAELADLDAEIASLEGQ